jgi:hypothetical protein
LGRVVPGRGCFDELIENGVQDALLTFFALVLCLSRSLRRAAGI